MAGIMTDAEHRTLLVDKINACSANIQTAAARADKADSALAEAEMELADLKLGYTKLRKELDLVMNQGEPAERTQAINQINKCLENVEQNKPRLHKAKAERGTAHRELNQLRAELTALQGQLHKLLPAELLVEDDSDQAEAAA